MILLLIAISAVFRHSWGLADPASVPGHLEKLGSRGVVKMVEEMSGFPDPATFFHKHSRPFHPTVFRGAAKASPAFKLWTDDYLKTAGTEEGLVVEAKKKESRKEPSLMMPLSQFVSVYHALDIYMVASLPSFLRKDVVLPACLSCGGFARNLVDTVLWFSSGGTKSVLHHDDVDNINCVLAGKKELYFIEYPKFKDKVPLDNPVGGYSSLDVDSVNFTEYPGMMDVEYEYVKMEEGDCLYIPYKWYHQVRSYDRNIAVNVWWNPLLVFNETDCQPHLKKPLPSLDDFDWPGMASKDGANDDDDDDDEEDENDTENGEDGDVRKYFKGFIKKQTWTSGDFINKIKSEIVTPSSGLWWTEAMEDIANKMFDELDFNKDNFVTKVDLQDLPNMKSLISLTNEIDEAIDDVKFGRVTNRNSVDSESSEEKEGEGENINHTEKSEL